MLGRVTNGIQSGLRACDLFAVTQFVRYKGESDFKTATGGFCSVSILTIFAVLFTSLAIKTVNRDIISWSSQTTNEPSPSLTNVTVSPSPFLFTVGIMGLDLNDPNERYFDISLIERVWSIGAVEVSNKSVSLVPCTEQHFAITDELKSTFHEAPAVRWLCPPLSYSFQLFGKFTSPMMKFIELRVQKCNSTLNPTRPCANALFMQQIQAKMGQFILSQLFINPLLNPGNQNYLDYYLQDRNYIAFTSNLGAYSNAHIEDYTIITDESILPFAIPKEESGVIISELFQNINFEVKTSRLASLFFYKSSSSTVYNRSYYKIDEFFSYVGGLVGVIMGGMMLLNSYNQLSFEISIASELYHHQESENPQKFNLIHFMMFTFYSLLKKVSLTCQKWQMLKKYEAIESEIAKQLDISVILTRILFLERSVQVLFDNGQFEAMHLNEKITLQQAKMLRHYYRAQDFLQVGKKQTKNQSLNELSHTANEIINLTHPIEKDPPQQEKQNSDSQDSSIEEELKINLNQSIKSFHKSIKAGNKRSLTISKGLKWNEMKFTAEPVYKQTNSLKSERKEFEQLSQMGDQNTHVLRVSKPKQGQPRLKLSNFQFITNLEEQNAEVVL